MTAYSSRITSRPYEGSHDLVSMRDFLVSSYASNLGNVYWHLGNLLWSRHFLSNEETRRDVCLWEGPDGALLGFAWFEGKDSLDLQIHPEHRYNDALESEILSSTPDGLEPPHRAA